MINKSTPSPPPAAQPQQQAGVFLLQNRSDPVLGLQILLRFAQTAICLLFLYSLPPAPPEVIHWLISGTQQ